jgi:hypothetical protein
MQDQKVVRGARCNGTCAALIVAELDQQGLMIQLLNDGSDQTAGELTRGYIGE